MDKILGTQKLHKDVQDWKNERMEYMTPGQHARLQHFLEADDLDFYEEYVIHLSEKEQEAFFADNPDFMSDFAVSHERMYLLRDRMFRDILRKIKDYLAKL